MRTSKVYLYAALGMIIGLGCAENAFAQYQVRHQAPTVVERESTVELTFEVPEINSVDVQDAFLFYRLDGDVSFRQQSAELNRSTFRISLDIPSDNASSLEYYLQIQFNDGSVQTFPADGASGNPVRVEIVENREQQVSNTGEAEGIEYTILSPEQGEEVLPNDVVIAITLFYDEEEIDTTASSFHLLLDGEDITAKADASDYFLTYVPDRLEAGEHAVTLLLRTGEAVEEIVSWGFTVSDGASTRSLATDLERSSPGWTPSGQMELGARNQMIAGNTSDILSGNFRLSGQNGNIRYSAYGLLTSQEDARLQPQNRYGAELYVGNWLELQAGHIYPALNPLTIAGQRVQGIHAAFHPFDHAINVQFMYGKLRRQVSNLYGPVLVQPQSFNDEVVDTSYALNIQDGGFGAFRRDIVGGRLGFGRGDNFQMGFNLLKVQDDTASIAVISDYSDLMNAHPEMTQALSPEDKSKLQANPNLLNVDGNPQPKGNLVAGSDLRVNLHNNRIQFRADGALSLLNDDISGGILSVERADELGFEIDQDVENLLDRLSWLIIINENMSTLPLRFQTEGEETTAETFFPKGILATQTELSLNYLDNNLRLQYRWVGPEFNSLANTTVRKDIAGYTISDRFRLLDNRIYVTLGYENLNDNVIGNREATTNTVTFRGNVSWYPIQRELPRVSLGLMSRSRENGIDLYNPFVSSSLAQAAVRNYREQDGTPVLAPNPRLANTVQFTTSVSQQFELFEMTHDASLNYSLLNTSDELFSYGGAKSNGLSFNLTNRFRDTPLDTRLGFSINNTETGSGLTNFRILGFNVGGSMFLLNDKLNVDAAIAFTKNNTEVVPLIINENGTPGDNSDDYYEPDALNGSDSKSHSYIFSAGARYTIDRNHAFIVNMRFTNVTSPLNSVQLPNDRLLQARYIFSF